MSSIFSFGPREDPVGITVEGTVHKILERKVLAFHNPIQGTWHVASIEAGGALVGSGRSRGEALARVRSDLQYGDRTIVREQIEMALKMMSRVTTMDPDRWYRLFKKTHAD